MNAKALAALIGGLATTFAAGSLPAHAQGWVLIGSQSVGFQTDTDRISGRGDGRFRAVRICVAGAPVHFRDVDVRFANGGNQDLPVRRLVRPGQCSQTIDLQGEARAIRQIVLRYNAVPNFRRRATVSVYGIAAVGPGRPTGRWQTLGTRLVGFGVERDTVSGRGEGRFRAIRLCVARARLHIRDLDVRFGNGERQDVPVQRAINPGQCTPALDLRGGSRRVRQVNMLYNAVPNFRGQALVTLQGLN